MARVVSVDRTARCPLAQACCCWDMDVPSLQPVFCAPQHCPGPWLWHSCRLPIITSQACPEWSNHSLPQFPLLAWSCFTSRGVPSTSSGQEIHVPFATTMCPGMGLTTSPHHQGPIGAAGTASNCSGQDAPHCPALALLQPPV